MGPLQVSSREVLVTPLNRKEVEGLGAEEEEQDDDPMLILFSLVRSPEHKHTGGGSGLSPVRPSELAPLLSSLLRLSTSAL